jgi:hypothetical protein
MQTDTLIEGMNRLGYQIASLSAREFTHGIEAFRAWQEKADFEFISANIVWRDTGEPVVAPTAIRKVTLRDGAKVKSVRIGFIGLERNDPAFLKERSDGRAIVTVDPLTAAMKHIPDLRKKADAIVALVSLDINAVRQLPKRVQGLDLVLGGFGAHRTRDDDFPEDTKLGRTRLLYIGHQGMHVGEIRARFDGEGRLSAPERHTVQLTRAWPDDPELAELVETTTVAINEYNKRQALASSPFAQPEPDAERANAAASGGAVPTQKTTAAFTGSARCAACHEEAYAIWSGSKHAHAFDVLVEANQNFNPKCVGCHTIGFGRPQGFVDVTTTPTLTHVGCEGCHGPSNGHPEEVGAGYGRTDTRECVTCHTRDNSPDYDPATYIPKVRHWTDSTATR